MINILDVFKCDISVFCDKLTTFYVIYKADIQMKSIILQES